MNCTICKAALPDLLLDPSAANASAREHMAACPDCAAEFAELQATFALLDTWEAPEVSPYFDQKLAVRLREEQAAPPAGWFERLRSRLLFNTGRQFRPALVGAMAVLLIAGGGGVGISTFSRQQATARASATVNDLQILDNNQQALEQVDQLLQDDTPDADNSDAPPS
jgi:anti-sigma factor RsiW